MFKHAWKWHGETLRQYICSSCSVSTQRRQLLTTHQRVWEKNSSPTLTCGVSRSLSVSGSHASQWSLHRLCYGHSLSFNKSWTVSNSSRTLAERRLVLICAQPTCCRSLCRDVTSSQTKRLARRKTGWLNVAAGSRPMGVQREGAGEGPVEQVCNLCVIWHRASTPILSNRRWVVLTVSKMK